MPHIIGIGEVNCKPLLVSIREAEGSPPQGILVNDLDLFLDHAELGGIE
jgi:hypothetical protein